jgi:folate-dependent phosphoribosylglycinamide formyltransferase PurN
MEREAIQVVLLTGDGLRHRYVASQLARSLRLSGIVYEAKAQIVAEPEKLPAEDQRVISEHLGQRDAVERRLLGEVEVSADIPALGLAHGEANSARAFEWIEGRRPDYIVVYGSSIIKPPLLTAYAGRMINIHLGLSPYYRGSGTNFWPLVHRQPECVGATLHVLEARLDAGPIVAQVRPGAAAADRAHELGTKTIVAAAALMPRVLAALAGGSVRPRAQDLAGGRLCRRRDFNADAVRTMWRQFDTGMMEEYLAQRDARNARFPLVELEASQSTGGHSRVEIH